jgi:hypothetical protein
MHNNDPTNIEYYNRCPLFGDLRPIEAIHEEKPNIGLRKCLDIIYYARGGLLIPFVQDLCKYLSGFEPPLHEDPYPNPDLIEELYGYPAEYLISFRVIYSGLDWIELRFCDAECTPVEQAVTISAARVEDFGRNILGVKAEVRDKIDAQMIFKLLAIKWARSAIKEMLVWGKPFFGRTPDFHHQRALTYLNRVNSIYNSKELSENQKQIQKLIPLEENKKKSTKNRSDGAKKGWEKRIIPIEEKHEHWRTLAKKMIKRKKKGSLSISIRSISKSIETKVKGTDYEDGWENIRKVIKGLKNME